MNLLAHCRKNGISFHRFSINAVRFAPTETYRHKRMKFEACEMISRNGGTFATEYPVFNAKGTKVGEVDVVWMEEMIAIEFETNFTEAKALEKCQQYSPFNTFVIDIGKEKTLEEIVDEVSYKIGLLKSRKEESIDFLKPFGERR